MPFFKHSGNSKKYCGILRYFGSTSYLYQRVPIVIEHISINLAIIYKAILDCLQSRKYCKAIMNDLLLFTTTKKSHIAKLDLLKALFNNELKISPKSVSILERNYNIWETLYLLRIGEYTVNCYKVG